MNIVPSIAAARSVRMAFTGTEGALFKVLLRGSLLQIPTFGFYRFWLITDVRRHLWSHTQIGVEPFEYTGRGKELLIGFLIALAVMVPVYIVYFIVALEVERLQAFASVPLFLVLYVLGHYARFRARRYRATRTVFRGLRFWMTGSPWAYVGRAVIWDLLTLATLGFAYPWRSAALERYKMRHTRYGTLEGAFVGKGLELFKQGGWLWAIFIFLAAGVGVFAAMEEWRSTAVFGFVLALFAPFLLPIFRAMEFGWWLEGVRFGRVEAASDLRIRTVVAVYAKTLLAWIAYGVVASIVIGLLGGIGAGLVVAIGGGDPAALENVGLPGAIAGGFLVTLVYIAFLLGLDIIRRLFLDRGLWAAAAASVTLTHLEALEEVVGAGAQQSGSLGEGLLDALDMGGF